MADQKPWERGFNIFEDDVQEPEEKNPWDRGLNIFEDEAEDEMDVPEAEMALGSTESTYTPVPDEPLTVGMPEEETPAEGEPESFMDALGKEEEPAPELGIPSITDVSGVPVPKEEDAFKKITPYDPEAQAELRKDFEFLKGIPSGVSATMMIPGAVMEKIGKVMDIPSYIEYGQRSREFWGEQTKEWAVEGYDVNPAENLAVTRSPGFWAYQLGKQAPLLIAGFTSGGTALGVLGGLQMGTQTYDEMLNEGASEEAASNAAMVDGVLGTVLERWGATKFLKAKGGLLKRTATGAAGEGLTEYSQEFTSSINKKIHMMVDNGASLQEAVNAVSGELAQYHREALGAGIVGAGIGGGFASISQVDVTEKAKKAYEQGKMDDITAQQIIEAETGLPPRGYSEIGWVRELENADQMKKSAKESAEIFESVGPEAWEDRVAKMRELQRLEAMEVRQPTAEESAQPFIEQAKREETEAYEEETGRQEAQRVLEQEQADEAQRLASEAAVQQFYKRIKESQLKAEKATKARRKREAQQEKRLTETEKVIGEDPIYKHVADIKSRGGISLDSLSKDWDVESRKGIIKKYPGLIRKDGKVNIDEIADEFGYESDIDFFGKLEKTEGRKALAQRMQEDAETRKEGLGEDYDKVVEAGYEILGEPETQPAGDIQTGEEFVIENEYGSPEVVKATVNEATGDVQLVGESTDQTVDVFDTISVIGKKSPGDKTEVDAETGSVEAGLEVLSQKLLPAGAKAPLRLTGRDQRKALPAPEALDVQIQKARESLKEGYTEDKAKVLGDLLERKDKADKSPRTYVSPKATTKVRKPRKVTVHKASGKKVIKLDSGKFRAEGLAGTFNTIAQANKALMDVGKAYEATGDIQFEGEQKAVPTTKGPEQIAKEKDFRKDQEKRFPKEVLRTTKTLKGPLDSTISPEESKSAQETLLQGVTEGAESNILPALMRGDIDTVLIALKDIAPSEHKSVIDAASKVARKRALAGEANLGDVDVAIDKAKTAIAGRKKFTGKERDAVRVEMIRDLEAPNMYQGTHPVTGEVYTVFRLGAKGTKFDYSILKEGKSIAQVTGLIDDAYDAIDKDVKQGQDYALQVIDKTHPEWTNRDDQVRIVDEDGNFVRGPNREWGFETQKDAKAAIKALQTGEPFVKGQTRTTKGTGKKGVATDLEKLLDEKKEEAEDTQADIRYKKFTETTTREIDPEEKARLIKEMNERLADLKLFDPEATLGPLQFEITDLISALDLVYDTATDEDGAVIGMLIKTIPEEKLLKTKVRPSTMSSTPDKEGSWYDVKDDTVYYMPGASPRAIAHEAVHAVTARELNQMSPTDPRRIRMNKAHNAFFEHVTKVNPETGLSILTPEEVADTTGTKEERLKALEKYPDSTRRFMYALGSMEEFFSMALTDPIVRAETKKIELPKPEQTSTVKTVWDQIKKIVFDMIGLPKEYYSLLEEVLELTTDIGQIAVDDKRVGDFKYGDYDYSQYNPHVIQAGKKQGKPQATKAKKPKFLEESEKIRKEGFEKDETKFVEKASKGVVKGIKYSLRSLDRSLHDVHPYLYNRFADYRSAKHFKTEKRLDSLVTFIKGMNRKVLKDNEYEVYHHALLNFHDKDARKVIKDIHAKHPELGDFKAVSDVLNGITKDMVEVGMLEKGREFYFPNNVSDLDGLMEHLTKEGEGTLLAKIKADLGKDASSGEIREAFTKALAQGNYPAMIARHGSEKKKSIYSITSDMIKFYDNPMDTLVNHIINTTKKIEQHRMIGTNSKFGKLEAQLRDLKAIPENKLTTKQKLKVAEVEAELNTLGLELEDSIASWLREKAEEREVPGDQQRAVVELLRSHFNEKATHPFIAAMKTMGTIGAIGSFTSTIAQIPDVGAPMIKFGGRNYISGLADRIKKNNLYSREDILGQNMLEQIGQTNTLGDILDWTLKWTGFSWADSFLKETAMQAGINKAKKMSRDAFVEKYKDTYNGDGEVQALYNELRSGKQSYNTARFAFNTLAEVQPVDTASMPQLSADNPKGRVIYTLQSYSIKQINNAVDVAQEGSRDGFKGLEGAPAGMLKMGAYVALLTALNTPVKCLQHLVTGKDCDISESIINAFLSIVALSRYQTAKLGEGDIVGFLMDSVIPPAGFIEKPLEDFLNLIDSESDNTIKTVTEIPIAGKIAYGWFSQDAKKKKLRKRKERIFGLEESMHKHGATDTDRAKLRKLIDEYNDGAVPMGERPIKASSFVKSRRNKERRKADKAKRTRDWTIDVPKVGFDMPKVDLSGILKAIGPSEAFAGEIPKDQLGEVDTEASNRRYKALVVGKAAKRLGVDYEEADKNLTRFAELVGQAENAGKTKGSNKVSTATGLYQFLEGSIPPAARRLKRIIGDKDWIEKALEQKTMNILTREQQTLFLLADLLEKDKSDPIMKKVMQGDLEAFKEAYKVLHHTKPDAATLRLIERVFKK